MSLKYLVQKNDNPIIQDKADNIAIGKLSMNCFRSYEHQNLNVQGANVLLTGHNGSGKSNILEAITTPLPGKNFRPSSLQDFYKRGSVGPCFTNIILANQYNSNITSSFVFNNQHVCKRSIDIDGKKINRFSEISRYLKVNWLTPYMDRLFVDSSSLRRKFFDEITSNFYPEHLNYIRILKKLVRERLELLKKGNFDKEWINSIEGQITKFSFLIAESRVKTIDLIQEELDKNSTPFPVAKISISGFLESQIKLYDNEKLKDIYLNKLLENRKIDALQGKSKIGPHCSDFLVRHGKNNMEAFNCSTGEQKALLISIFLADIRLQKNNYGYAPIILLDEIASHLDNFHRTSLLLILQKIGSQTWITTTDGNFFDTNFKNFIHYTIDEGNIKIN